jgi:hypothetical protein
LGGFLLDNHGHLIVEHDLFNHDGLTEDGIAEAFMEFAKKEGLSFFDCRGERPFAPTKLQSERDSGGSIIQHWQISEIEQILIPIINLDLQIIISDKIKENFRLRVRSKDLLEIAKKGVEKAIKSDEQTAIKWLNDELEKIGIEVYN